jgi:hypothetical protein
MKKRCGFYGNWLENEILKVRWWRNKTIASRPSHFGKWHSLGAYLESTPEFPRLPAICVRRWLESYVDKTNDLPRVSDLTFLSVTRHQGRHKGIGAQRVSKDVGAAMTECGIPERFMPHSTRHASLSKKVTNGVPIDNITADADVSAKVFKLFYAQPVTRERMDALACIKFTGSRAKRMNMRQPPALAAFADGAVVLQLEDTAADRGHDDDDVDVVYEVDQILDEAVDVVDGVITPKYKVLWVAGDVTFETRDTLMLGAAELLREFEEAKEATTSLVATKPKRARGGRMKLKRKRPTGPRPDPAAAAAKVKKKKKIQATPRCAPAIPTPSASVTTSDFETALVDEDMFCGAGHANKSSASFCTTQKCDLPVMFTSENKSAFAASSMEKRSLARVAPRREPAAPRAPRGSKVAAKVNTFRVTRSRKAEPPTKTTQLSYADCLTRAARSRAPVRESRRAPSATRRAQAKALQDA